MSDENGRRRRTAGDAWFQQLTPQERADVLARGQRELDCAGQVVAASSEVLAAAEALTAEAPAHGEVREALQRAIERRG